MSLQNRVTPGGQLEAVSARGTLLGNRGILHDENKQIVIQWRHQSWVTCALEFKGRKRTLFGSRTYSELFFLDEATALAAGHRPCAECRRARFNEFKAAWCAAYPELVPGPKLPVAMVDKHLHAARVKRNGSKVTYSERLGVLPPGTFVLVEGAPHLLWADRLLRWSHRGYSIIQHGLPSDLSVDVLTPRPVVAVLNQGFKPQVHQSAQ